MLLAAVAGTTAIPPIICTILLIATIIALIVGLAEVFGLRTFTGSRYGALLVFVVLLVVYIVIC